MLASLAVIFARQVAPLGAVLLTLTILGPLPITAQAVPAKWVVAREISIGSNDRPKYALTEVDDIQISHDGSIYVLQGLERKVRVYSRTGSYLREFGRQGEGPGEFGNPTGMGWIEDTLWIADSRLQRVSFFDTEGNFLESAPLAYDPPGPRFNSTVAQAVFSDGSIVLRPWTPARRVASGEISSVPILRVPPGDRALDTLLTLPLQHEMLSIHIGSITSPLNAYIAQPFSDTPLWTPLTGRDGILTLERRASGVDIPTVRLSRITPQGERRDLATIERPGTLLTRAVSASRLGKLSSDVFHGSRGRIASVQAALELVEERLYWPEFVPPATDLLAGLDGSIWIRLEDLPERPFVEWMILSERGELQATLCLPSDFRVMQADGSRIWGVVYDEWDVPQVIRYRILEEPSGSDQETAATCPGPRQ